MNDILLEAVEPKIEIRSYVYLRRVVNDIVSGVLEGMDEIPVAPAYQGDGPNPNPPPDAVIWISIGDSSHKCGGKMRPELLRDGWNWVRETRVNPEMEWIRRNPQLQNIAVLLHNPFGNWRKWMHLDQWDYARAAQLSEVTGESWDAWADVPYDVRAYVGASTTCYPFEYPMAQEQSGYPFQDTSMAEYTRMVIRNLIPYQRVGMGLVVDVMSNMVVSTIKLIGDYGTVYKSQEAVCYYIMKKMFGHIGIEQLPKGPPTGHTRDYCYPVLECDGYCSDGSFRRMHGDLYDQQPQDIKDKWAARGKTNDISHVKGNIYRLLSGGSGNVSEFMEGTRRILSDGHVPCLGYINEIIKAGGNPMELTPS